MNLLGERSVGNSPLCVHLDMFTSLPSFLNQINFEIAMYIKYMLMEL